MENNNFDKIIEVINFQPDQTAAPGTKSRAHSMCDYLIEECFELVEAIRQNDPAEAAEELGDVLFLLLFIGRASTVQCRVFWTAPWPATWPR